MDQNYWNKIERIVDEALTLPPSERDVFISEQCNDDQVLKSEVNTLLEFICKSEGWLENPEEYKEALYEDICKDLEFDDGKSLVGQQVGAYTIIRELGRGGMGSIYLAQRSDGAFEHQVAIKIIRYEKASDDNVRRFKREQEILAGLNHHGIARLYDGGMTKDHFPYIIMEYVEGTPIDEYCQNEACSIDELIKLVKQILEAIKYAHENLVIHRDLKPSNILVTNAGNIKVLDFGISKFLQEDDRTYMSTRSEERLLTPKYAAPEQIKQKNISTATDLYTLGLIFYELLAGVPPFKLDGLSYFEIEKTIVESTIEKPSKKVTSSQARKRIEGDLDAIVLKALRKEPQLRYRSANEFLDDLNRCQDGLPVSARKDSLQYRTQKFIDRHKRGILITGFIVLFIIGLTAFYTLRIAEERNEAKFEARKAQNISNFLMDLFQANDPTIARGNTVTARDLLTRGVKRADILLDQPKIQAQMYDVIGQVYRRLGEYNKSKDLLSRAVTLRKIHYGPEAPETAASLDHLGLLFCNMGEYKEAEQILRRSNRIQKINYGSKNLKTAHTQSLLAYALRREGKYDQAEKLYRSSLNIQQEQLGDNDLIAIETKSSLGATLHNKGKYKKAEELFREVLNQRRNILGNNHPDVAMSLNNLAALLMNEGEFKEAEPLLRESLAMRKKLFGTKHPKVALTMNNLALIVRDQGKYAEAEHLFKKALQMRLDLLGANNIATAITQYGLAELMLETDRPDSALSLYRKALKTFHLKLSGKHSFTARTIMGMGSAQLERGKMEIAQELLTKGFNVIKEIHSPTSLERALADFQMGKLFYERQKFTRADSLFNHSYHTLKKIEGTTTIRQTKVKYFLELVDKKLRSF